MLSLSDPLIVTEDSQGMTVSVRRGVLLVNALLKVIFPSFVILIICLNLPLHITPSDYSTVFGIVILTFVSIVWFYGAVTDVRRMSTGMWFRFDRSKDCVTTYNGKTGRLTDIREVYIGYDIYAHMDLILPDGKCLPLLDPSLHVIYRSRFGRLRYEQKASFRDRHIYEVAKQLADYLNVPLTNYRASERPAYVRTGRVGRRG